MSPKRFSFGRYFSRRLRDLMVKIFVTKHAVDNRGMAPETTKIISIHQDFMNFGPQMTKIGPEFLRPFTTTSQVNALISHTLKHDMDNRKTAWKLRRVSCVVPKYHKIWSTTPKNRTRVCTHPLFFSMTSRLNGKYLESIIWYKWQGNGIENHNGSPIRCLKVIWTLVS